MRMEKLVESLNLSTLKSWEKTKFLIEAEEKLGLIPRDIASLLGVDVEVYRFWTSDNSKLPSKYREKIECLVAQASQRSPK